MRAGLVAEGPRWLGAVGGCVDRSGRVVDRDLPQRPTFSVAVKFASSAGTPRTAADAVLTQWAWGIGSFTQPGGGDRPIAPVHWRTKDEAWQAQVSAALAAESTRDAAMAAAINALVTAVNAGSTGTPLDSATIVAVVRQEAERTRQALLAQATREAAAARAEADALADGPADA